MPAPLAVAGPDRDANLLFGVLCLQADSDRRRPVRRGLCPVGRAKNQSLADLLCERGWLSNADRSLVDVLVQKKLRKHGDACASLAALTLVSEARQALASIADPEVQRSLASLSLEPSDEPSTVAYQPPGRGRYVVTGLHAARRHRSDLAGPRP